MANNEFRLTLRSIFFLTSIVCATIAVLCKTCVAKARPTYRRFVYQIDDVRYEDSYDNYDAHQCKCGQLNVDLLARIVGGEKVEAHKYPWLTAIYKGNQFHCGGSIINDKYILTAAHCIFNQELKEIYSEDNFSVVLGQYQLSNKSEITRQNFQVKEIKLPIYFTGDDLHDIHDIALLKLDKKIIYTLAVKPICLPTSQSFTYVGKFAILNGWGTLKYRGLLSNYPFEAAVLIISDERCKQTKVVGPHFAEDPRTMFCAYTANSDACQGDSGGPLIVLEGGRFVQIGIISWGIECASEGIPGVYTRLTNYLDWIHDNTKDGVYCTQ